ncbi:hypothetical protein [Actinomadura opuntiae]|uniref:hypothetical protein n=1 Tax=Actinomadura sp. OS1-43 TaxID=604315 RepID=UPI00255A7B18|nr:hypothetical protein [Actinomadura sp. OS1-43]MDL4818550.1 hypothetical protein [Actinomadura sp. OS1-43]
MDQWRPERGSRQAFRAWVRAHHPDAGGDRQAFTEGLRRWRDTERRPGPPRPGGQIIVFRSRGGLWQVRRWWKRHARTERRVV